MDEYYYRVAQDSLVARHLPFALKTEKERGVFLPLTPHDKVGGQIGLVLSDHL